jgi:hypothetical protein
MWSSVSAPGGGSRLRVQPEVSPWWGWLFGQPSGSRLLPQSRLATLARGSVAPASSRGWPSPATPRRQNAGPTLPQHPSTSGQRVWALIGLRIPSGTPWQTDRDSRGAPRISAWPSADGPAGTLGTPMGKATPYRPRRSGLRKWRRPSTIERRSHSPVGSMDTASLIVNILLIDILGHLLGGFLLCGVGAGFGMAFVECLNDLRDAARDGNPFVDWIIPGLFSVWHGLVTLALFGLPALNLLWEADMASLGHDLLKAVLLLRWRRDMGLGRVYVPSEFPLRQTVYA